MGRLFHFGDSYGTTGMIDKHYIQDISERINHKYIYEVVPGSSNEEILTKLLSSIMDIKEGDILFFNFSFFTRGCYYDREESKIISTNYFYNDSDKDFTIGDHKDYIIDIISYQLDNNEDYNRRLFFQFDTIFKQLHRRNIPINYIFIRENEWSNSLLNYGTKISFSPDFYTWLNDNGYHNNQECHYTLGVQPIIRDYIMKQFIHSTDEITPYKPF